MKTQSYVFRQIASPHVYSSPTTLLLTVNPLQPTLNIAVTLPLTTTSRRQQQTHMLTLFFLSRLYFSRHTAISRPKNSLPATHLLIMNTLEKISHKSITPHLSTSCWRQQQTYLLTHFLFSKAYVFRLTAASTLINSLPTTHLPMKHTSQPK